MPEKRVFHLPIMNVARTVGIISIRDAADVKCDRHRWEAGALQTRTLGNQSAGNR